MRFLLFLIVFAVGATADYKLGAGIADVTGPIVGVTLMGYGDMEQQGSGVHLRQWSRTFIIKKGNQRLVFVNVDCAMMSDGVRLEVIDRLKIKYGDIYNLDNVMISATHSHSGVGGYLMHTLFDFPSFGFSSETFEAMVSGIVKSVEMAHRRLISGKLYLKKARVENANINRSPTSYKANPEKERNMYPDDVDKDLVQLQFFSSKGAPIGVINWFAVHATSMNRTNTLVSSDNVGYASILFEEKMNPGNILGKGPFVAAFASSNLGDVSPNIMGPLCHPSGAACSDVSTCSSFFDSCFALGPGKDMFESTKIIAERIFDTAWQLWSEGPGKLVDGQIRAVHQYVDMPTATVDIVDPNTNSTIKGKGCRPAMGYSFAAGTIDGPFADKIVHQGTKKSFPILDWVSNVILAKPSVEDRECHAPKPILVFTGGMTYPFDWQPRIVSTQLAFIGDLALVCVPGEFTTMSGRRIRNIVEEEGPPGTQAVLVGLCNTYSDYITTFEEYQVQRFEGAATLYGPYTLDIHLSQFKKLTHSLHGVQRYEGGSTLYGPHTLSIYLEKYRNLTKTIINNTPLARGPEPKGLRQNHTSLILPVVFDTPGWSWQFGDVLEQPTPIVVIGEKATATFISGHPRNNLKLDDTYLTIEYQTSPDIWKVVATDSNWETRFHWRRSNSIFGTSVARVEYYVPASTKPGLYRIRHFGHVKDFSGEVRSYDGTTNIFKIVARGVKCSKPTFTELL